MCVRGEDKVRTLRTFRTFPPLIKDLFGLRQVGLSPTAAYSPKDKVCTLRTFRTFPPLAFAVQSPPQNLQKYPHLHTFEHKNNKKKKGPGVPHYKVQDETY